MKSFTCAALMSLLAISPAVGAQAAPATPLLRFDEAIRCAAASLYIVDAHPDLGGYEAALAAAREDAIRLGRQLGLSRERVEARLRMYVKAHQERYFNSDAAASDAPLIGEALQDARNCRTGGYLAE